MDDDDALHIIEDPTEPAQPPVGPWRILIVDDEADVHEATRLALRDLVVEGRPLAFAHVYSAQEAHSILASDPEIAVVLLDVVMECEDAGLRLARQIREEIDNQAIRIILCTGQPGYAPEIDIIQSHDINDYKTKSELTRVRLFTSLTVAIRSYRQIRQLETNRRDLARQEQRLIRSRTKLRALTAHREKVREEERALIARDLHDETGQYLTALRMEASMLEMLFTEPNAEVARRLRLMRDLIDHAIGETRRVITRLRPVVLDLGIVSAAEWLAEDFRARTGIPCHLAAPGLEALELDQERATTLFRILQESLTNVSRHACARHVDIQIARSGSTLTLEVRDDGQGFDPLVVRRKKTFGLMGIRERVLLYGGSARIESHPGQGTSLRITLPLYDEERA